MKKKLFVLFSLILTLCFVGSNTRLSAKNELNNDPYETYIVGLDGNLNESPLAYEGVSVINPGLDNAQDICIVDDILYIADKGNKVIWKYDINLKTYEKIGEGILTGPTGVCLGSDKSIYVTDYDAKKVYRFNPDGTVNKIFERPTEALFGEESQFRPSKIAVDRRGNLYITSDGNANGIIQLNEQGEFVGYFGPNNVNLTLSLMLKRLMLPKEDRDTYASLTPKVTTNLTIDSKNIVYTIIEGETGVSLKKFNVNGTNILAKANFFSSTYQDITVDNQGFIYTVDKSDRGAIQVMDVDGSLLFSFGSTSTGSISVGEFDKASGIAVDSSGNIWILDGGGNNIQVFRKTEFANTVFNAILAYNEGKYDEAVEYYNEIISQNSSFVNAYIGLGKIAQRAEDYDAASYYFKIANYKSGYSEVFWEKRDNWLGKNLVWIIILIIIIVILRAFKVFRKLWKYIPAKLIEFKNRIVNSRIMSELKYLGKILKKPNDTFYDIKFLLSIRVRTAVLVLVAFILINIFGDFIIRGYLFRETNLQNVNFSMELLKWGLIIIVFVFANYLISTLQSGEGFFRDIFIGAVFSFAPLILFKLPVDILSNVLTYNEMYIYTLLQYLLWAWSIFNLIMMLKEIHNYTVKELIVNIILTFIAVVVIVLLYLVIYILANQLIQFIIGLIKERGFM